MNFGFRSMRHFRIFSGRHIFFLVEVLVAKLMAAKIIVTGLEELGFSRVCFNKIGKSAT